MFSIDNSILLVIDVQGRLAQRMFEKKKLFKNIQTLIQGARRLDIPILCTEQAPEKIGKTIPEIARYLEGLTAIPKLSFSSCGEPFFLEKLRALKRTQIIVCGIETHVCVYQTAVDLIGHKFDVQVAADAVSSRTRENKHWGLERMKFLGVPLTSTEMIACELLRTARHKKFKDVLGLIK